MKLVLDGYTLNTLLELCPEYLLQKQHCDIDQLVMQEQLSSIRKKLLPKAHQRRARLTFTWAQLACIEAMAPALPDASALIIKIHVLDPTYKALEEKALAL